VSSYPTILSQNIFNNLRAPGRIRERPSEPQAAASAAADASPTLMLDACLTSVINFGPFPRQQIITRRTKLKTLHSFQTLRKVEIEKRRREEHRTADEGGRQAGRRCKGRRARERERERERGRERALGLAWSVRLPLQSIIYLLSTTTHFHAPFSLRGYQSCCTS
jgi:hypothetical protein